MSLAVISTHVAETLCNTSSISSFFGRILDNIYDKDKKLIGSDYKKNNI
jgi:hypothetical protein